MPQASSVSMAVRAPLRDDLKLISGPATPGGAPTWTLQDPVRQAFFRIGRREFEILQRWDRSPEEIVGAVHRETTVRVDSADIEALRQFLAVNGLLSPANPAARGMLLRKATSPRGSRIQRFFLGYLFFRIPLARPDAFLTRTLPLVRQGARLFRVLMLPLLVCALVVLLRRWSEFVHTFTYFFSPGGIVMYAVAIFGAKVAHELGHAYAAKHFGLKVPTLGVAFMFFWPILYTDNTDAWRLRSRKTRMAIVAAGILVELAIAILATLLWAISPQGTFGSVCFILASVTWITSLGINLMPFMRYDGYYFLSDWLDIPNLHQRAFALGRWQLHRLLFGAGDPPPEPFDPGRRRLLILFAYVTWLYRLLLFTGLALMVYHLLFKALGIVMFGVELFWFIGRPVAREVRTWPRMAGEAGRIRQGLLFLICLVLLSWLALPVESHIRVPAVLKPGTGNYLYAPVAARIRTLHLENGAEVTAGTVLVELDSPDLDHAIDLAESQERLLETRLKRESGDSALLEQHQVLSRQLAEIRTALSGYEKQKEQLVIKAATDGIISDMAEGLQPGRWVNPGEALALLVDCETPYVEGFVPEALLGRIQVGAGGRFYPEVPEGIPSVGKLTKIDTSATRRLASPYLASVYGGALPVARDVDGLSLRESLFRVRMTPDGGDADFQVIPGTLRIRAESRSRIVGVWHRLMALVIRESGV